MNKRFGKFFIVAIFAAIPSEIYAKQWTLKECINYALENNISLQKTQIKKASANEDYLQSKAALLPSLASSSWLLAVAACVLPVFWIASSSG